MPSTVATKNAALDWLAANHWLYMSVHNSAPGSTGAGEVAGGSPAYARKVLAWNAASGGAITTSSNPTFDVPAGTTAKYVGFWDDVSATGGSHFKGYETIGEQDFVVQGTLPIGSVTRDLNATASA